VQYWADLQSVHGLRCYGNMTPTRNVSEYMLVLTLCLVFGRPFVKRFRPMLSDRCLSVCPVLSVTLLYCRQTVGRNRTDQDETWHAGRPRLQTHCVRWGSSSLTERHTAAPHIRNLRAQALPASVQSAVDVYCGQTAGLIKMPLGREVGLGQATLC